MVSIVLHVLKYVSNILTSHVYGLDWSQIVEAFLGIARSQYCGSLPFESFPFNIDLVQLLYDMRLVGYLRQVWSVVRPRQTLDAFIVKMSPVVFHVWRRLIERLSLRDDVRCPIAS